MYGTVLRVVLSVKQAALTADDRLCWSLIQAEMYGTVLRVVLSMKQAALTAGDRLCWSLGTG